MDHVETFIDIEKNIEDSLVLSLKIMMDRDTTFHFDQDEKLSKIRITAARPKDLDTAKPHVYISSSGYSVAEAGLSNGWANVIMRTEDMIDKEIDVFKYKVNFSAEIMVAAATSSESKNLANRIVSRLFIRGRKVIIENLGLNIQNIQKSRESKTQLSQNSSDLFINAIGVSGEFFIDVETSDKVISGVLRRYTLEFAEINRTYSF